MSDILDFTLNSFKEIKYNKYVYLLSDLVFFAQTVSYILVLSVLKKFYFNSHLFQIALLGKH